MTVTMSRTDGVTIFTVTSDPESRWPLLCQILKSLCYSPVCCSVSQQLRKTQRTSLSVLGALQIMIGLLHIGLGINLLVVYYSYWFTIRYTGFPFWLGALFIVFGIISILSEKYPSPCLVIINVILNLAGVAFAITAIVLYSIYVANIRVWYSCEQTHYWGYTTPSPTSDMQYIENCLRGKTLIVMLLRSITGVLIVISAVELCAVISSAVLGIQALRSINKKKNKSCDDPEQYNALLDEVTA
ncbi:hypothetical protein CHARACLAT_023640 [Characodon lateralis]|uniref:Uncharacterized protein n=1 Tax=Characodon lateralis TaxID=208331 RepID=A0ABU7F5F5_9TELE|nr:hypothetical protein [Characodon lateralis]